MLEPSQEWTPDEGDVEAFYQRYCDYLESHRAQLIREVPPCSGRDTLLEEWQPVSASQFAVRIADLRTSDPAALQRLHDLVNAI